MVAAAWQPDGTGVTDGGLAGDHIQRGRSWSVRFVRPDLPGSRITVTFYAAACSERPGGFVVQRQIEWLVCEDPADPWGTEVWSDTDYKDVTDEVIRSQGAAEREARRFAEAALGLAADYGQWDGQPEWGR